MNCQNCGAEVGDKRFCPQCGAQVQTAPAAVPAAAPAQPASQGNYTQVLVFGILGLALGASTGIVGLIFSILGIRKANEYIATYGDISTQQPNRKTHAKAGRAGARLQLIPKKTPGCSRRFLHSRRTYS